MPTRPQGQTIGERSWRVALVLVFALVACLAARQVSSGDVGFHLAAGSWILEGHGWPRTDPFTFTVADHAYVDTSWGYQVVLALLERAFGPAGLVLLHVALILLTWVLVYRTAAGVTGDRQALVLFTALGAVACEMRYDVRPEVLSYTLLALVLYLLHRHAAGSALRTWYLPVVFVVWVNCHSLFVLGWIALGCFVLGLWLRDRRPDLRLIGWSASCVAVTLLNPYGWRGVAFPFTLLTRFGEENPFNQTIGEFVSPFDLALSEQFPFYPRLPIYSFRLLFALVALALIPLIRRKRWCLVLLALPFGYLSFSMVRNIPLLVVACLPVVAAGLGGLPGSTRRRRRWPGRAVPVAAALTVALTLSVFHDAYYISSRRQDRFGLGWNERTQPVAATQYAQRAGLDGRVLNHLNFGGYLMWAGARRVFIDGRLEVMGEEFFDEYRQVLSSEAALERTVARYDIEWLVFPHRINRSLLRALDVDPRWTLAYVDPLAVIFTRADKVDPLRVHPGVSQRPVEPLGATSSLPGLDGTPRRGAVSRRLLGLVRRERYPHAPFHLGLFHYFRGDTVRAATHFARAIRDSDGAYYEIYHNLGASLYRMNRLREARDCYRVVLAEIPDYEPALKRLAQIEHRLSSAGD